MLLFELLKFYFALGVVLVIPGYFFGKFLLAVSWKRTFILEKIVIVGVLGLALVNFGMIFMGSLSLQITKLSLFAYFAISSFIFYFLAKRASESKERKSDIPKDQSERTGFAGQDKTHGLLSLSYRQYLIFLAIVIFALAVRSFYVSKGIFPQTTDLGHHMYWSKYISVTGNLPEYGMPDFIIGEHLVFAAVQVISGISYVSAFPVTLILLVNALSLFAIFLLAFESANLFFGKEKAKKIALVSFFVIGVLYPIADPQAKFISGGVIGNIFGNLFIPLSFYFFIKAIKARNSPFPSLFIISFAVLIYTHHLSAFIFLYSFGGFLLLWLLLIGSARPFGILRAVKQSIRPFLSSQALLFAGMFLLFLFIISPPSYLNTEAIDTAVGAPSKETRVGLSLPLIVKNVGPWRFLYGMLGIFILGYLAAKYISSMKEKSINYSLLCAGLALLLSWGAVIFLMSYKPALLKVDIPSNRIVNYLTLPFTILCAIGAFQIVNLARKKLSRFLSMNVFVFVFGVGMISGLSDISESDRSLSGANDFEARQTYAAAEYLAQIAQKDEMVLKDHIYLSGDTWMKLFFMREYRFPLSRSYLRRYEDVAKDRETCTRDMVAIPESQIGRQCFDEYNVKYVVLKKGFDTAQFERSINFDKIYSSDSVAIYYKTN